MIIDFNKSPKQPDWEYDPGFAPHMAPINAFAAKLAEYDLHPDDIIPDGNIHRFAVGKNRSKAGWYVFFQNDDICGASFGNWQADIKGKWCSINESVLTYEQRTQYLESIKKANALRKDQEEKNHQEAKEIAQKEWAESEEVFDQDHPYLKKKNVNSHGLRVNDDEYLLIPSYDEKGELWSLERIDKKGGKWFQEMGRRKGLFFEFKGNPGFKQIYIVEGYSTGATVHEVTGRTVVCAFNAGQMPRIAKLVKKYFPSDEIVIAADNDFNKVPNQGIVKGTQAAREIDAPIVWPEFPDWKPDPNIPEKDQKAPSDFNDLFALEGGAAVAFQLNQYEFRKNTIQKFRLLPLADIQLKAPEWLVKNFIERDSLVILFGDPASGKTFIVIHLVCCIASGMPFFGMPIKQGVVIYIAGEGQNGLKRRFMAWAIRHGVNLDEYPIFLSMIPASLSESDHVAEVKKAISTVAQEYGPPALIVFDTIARNFGPGDENSTRDMNAVISGLDEIRRLYQSAIVSLHHSGHGDKARARGAMALKGALDSEYRIEKDDMGTIRMTCTKMKDFDVPNPMAFKLVTVDLSVIDEDGGVVTSAVLKPVVYSEKKEAGKSDLQGNKKIVFEAFKDLFIHEQNRLIKNGMDFSEATVFKTNLQKHLQDKINMPKTTAHRLINDFLSKHPEVAVIDSGNQFKYLPPFSILGKK